MKKTTLLVLVLTLLISGMMNMARADEGAAEGTSLGEFAETLSCEDQAALEKDLTEAGISISDAKDVRITAGNNTLTLLVDEDSPLPPRHLFYLGVRLGIMFPYGLEGAYEYKVDGLTRFQADVGVTTSKFLHSIELGGAWHPRDGRAFFMGLRTKDVILFNSDRGYKGIFDPYQADHFFSVGPEIGWQKAMGSRKLVLGTIALGAQKAWGQSFDLPIMPEIRFALAIRIFKK